MSKPRTVAQRYADYKRTFPRKVNDRRCDLIQKKHSGFTPEESSRRFDLDPAWKDEFDRQCRENLTDAERAELTECTRVVDEWQAKAPWTIDQAEFQAEKEARFEAILGRLKGKRGIP